MQGTRRQNLFSELEKILFQHSSRVPPLFKSPKGLPGMPGSLPGERSFLKSDIFAKSQIFSEAGVLQEDRNLEGGERGEARSFSRGSGRGPEAQDYPRPSRINLPVNRFHLGIPEGLYL